MTEMVQLVPAWHPYQSSLDQPFLAASLTIGTLSQKPRQSPPRGTTAKLAKLLKTSIMATPWPSHTANRQEDTLDTRAVLAYTILQALNHGLPLYVLLTIVPSAIAAGALTLSLQLLTYTGHTSLVEVRS
jgi:hypothetical protein